MKTGNRRFLILLSVLTALCCIAVVLINFMGMPPFDSTAAAVSTPMSSGSFSSGAADSTGASSLSPASAAPSSKASASSSATSGAPVNINTADADALASLPGIGDTLAQRIIDYRNAHGPFTSTAQLDQVTGIGQKRMAELKGLITV